MSARIFNCLLVMLVLSATRTALADGPSSGQDLQATIVLNGQPCDQVVGVNALQTATMSRPARTATATAFSSTLRDGSSCRSYRSRDG